MNANFCGASVFELDWFFFWRITSSSFLLSSTNQPTSSHAWKGRWYKLMEGVRQYLRNASDDTCVWIGEPFFAYLSSST